MIARSVTMRTLVLSCLVVSVFFSPARAGEKEVTKKSSPIAIDAIKVEEDLHLCGGVSWSVKLSVPQRADESQIEELKAKACDLLGLTCENLTVGEVGDKFVSLFPSHVAMEIPVTTAERTYSVIELRTVKQPNLEQVRFFHDTTGVSAVARFKSGTATVAQLESLVKIAKMTEAQNAAVNSCGAASCGTSGCTDCGPNCGCTAGPSPVSVLPVALTKSTCTDSNTCTSCCADCADCSENSGLKMTQIDERTFAFERLQK